MCHSSVPLLTWGQPESQVGPPRHRQGALPIDKLLLNADPGRASATIFFSCSIAAPTHKLLLNLVNAKKKTSPISSCTISPSTDHLVTNLVKFKLRHGSKFTCFS